MHVRDMNGSRGRTPRRTRPILAGLAALVLLAACDSAEERKQSHQQRGQEFAAAGETDKALIEFTNALRIDPAFAPAHEALARLHRGEGRPAAAAGHYEAVAEARPDDLGIRLELARVYLDLRALDRMAPHVDAALALAPEDPHALGLAASADLLRGEVEQAVARARAALDRDPDEDLARLVLVAAQVRDGDPREALALLEAAPGLGGAAADLDLDLELVRIQLLERLGDREAVGAALRRLVEREPENEGLRLALARWHMQADPPDLVGAEAELRAVAALRPDEPGPRLRVVDFLQRTRGDAAARAELEALIAAGATPEESALYERALAVTEARTGDRAAAVARMEAAVAREGDTDAGDAARLLLIRLLEGPDAEARQAELLEAVLARDPANAEALAMRGELAIRDDRPEDAVRDLRAALEQDPRNPVLLELLAEAHDRNGDDALAAERRALAVQASGAAPGPSLRYAARLVREGKTGTAESVLLDALARAPADRRLVIALIEVRLARRDWDGAGQAIEALEALDAEAGGERAGPVVDQLRAAALLGEGRTDETVELLRRGWETRGGDFDMEALVRGYAAAGALDEAEAFLDGILRDRPDDALALALLAEVRLADGDAAGAEASLRRAVAAAPENPRLHRRLAGLLAALGRDAEAGAALEAGLAAVPGDRNLRFDKALRLEAEGDPEAAIAVYEALYAENSGDVLVANNLAALLSDHRTDAESLQRAAVVARRLRGAEAPAFQDTYGWTLHLSGDSAQAVAVLRESAPRLPGNPTAQFHLGMAYAAIGQAALAKEQLALALALADAGAPFPQRAQAEAELARLEAAAAAAGSDG